MIFREFPHVQKFAANLKCLSNPERDLKLWGNYGTTRASNLVIVFDRCDNATSKVVCKSEE